MRELKFRVFIHEYCGGDIPFEMYNKMDYSDNLEDFFSIYPPSFFEIMQYTGLKDVNGKMIFEGDIVKNIFIPKSAYEVKFQDGCFFVGDFALGITIDPDFHTLETMDSEEWVEVIGNIHENPNILKKK